MRRNHARRRYFISITVTAFLVYTTLSYLSESANAGDALRVTKSDATGVARFVMPEDSRPITLSAAPGSRTVEPLDAIRAYGNLFGVSDPQRELVLDKGVSDALGHTHTTFRQVHNEVPVFAALLRTHMDEQKRLIAINGTFIPDIAISVVPVLSADNATAIAVEDVAVRFEESIDIKAMDPTLYVFRMNLARGFKGINHLVWEVEVGNGNDVREFVYVDAHKGVVVDRITGIYESIHRRVYDQGFDDGSLVWEEGDSLPYGETDIDNLIDYSEDTYNLVASATNGVFLSWDGADGIMHVVNDHPEISCPNANWNGTSTNYCPDITADDTVGHEWGHAFTESTHNLIYQWQPGALNESYSDIYGEVVDFLNGAGTDSPIPLRSADGCSTFTLPESSDDSLRWLAGEDSSGFGGAIRDMWNPNCYEDPGKVTDTVQYYCGTGDHGGVHTNSGIPNHAFALLVDSGTFNGQTIMAIGLTKAFHI